MTKECRSVFIAGGTGYMGQSLIPRLLERGHEVRALVRPGSERKLPSGCTAVTGNALDASSYSQQISPADTFVQLVGVAHPSPAEVCRIPDDRSSRWAGSGIGGEFRGHSAFCVYERGASGAHEARLHCGTY